MPTLPQLKDPAGYRACQWDLLEDDDRRQYWLGLFKTHFVSLCDHAIEEAEHRSAPRPPVEAMQKAFNAWLDHAGQTPCPMDRLDVVTICYEREKILRAHQVDDPYRLAKAEQNATCLKLLPALLHELDALPEAERDIAIIQGVFAGNIFDLGATETIELFAKGEVHFDQVRAKLKPRPWLVDGLDAWQNRLAQGPHQLAVLFVDNAGPDICLGMVPFARYLLSRGTKVVLTANAEPALNDVTIDELNVLLQQIAAFDQPIADALADGRLRAVSSGNIAPLIELNQISDELAELCTNEPVDLIVLEGMGRGVESNHTTPFNCDVMKIAMLKDPSVATALGGNLYDLVCRFEPIAATQGLVNAAEPCACS